jgi:hypothetical protein
LPSPIIGTCVLSILTTILYRWGVPVHITMLCACAETRPPRSVRLSPRQVIGRRLSLHDLQPRNIIL